MTDGKSKIEVLGKIVECLPGTRFKVEIVDEGYPEGFVVEGHLSGKMRVHYIKIMTGDHVKLELSPYDMEKGRITYRYKGKPPKEVLETENSETSEEEGEEISQVDDLASEDVERST